MTRISSACGQCQLQGQTLNKNLSNDWMNDCVKEQVKIQILELGFLYSFNHFTNNYLIIPNLRSSPIVGRAQDSETSMTLFLPSERWPRAEEIAPILLNKI